MVAMQVIKRVPIAVIGWITCRNLKVYFDISISENKDLINCKSLNLFNFAPTFKISPKIRLIVASKFSEYSAASLCRLQWDLRVVEPQ